MVVCSHGSTLVNDKLHLTLFMMIFFPEINIQTVDPSVRGHLLIGILIKDTTCYVKYQSDTSNHIFFVPYDHMQHILNKFSERKVEFMIQRD